MTPTLYHQSVATPLGTVTVTASDNALLALAMGSAEPLCGNAVTAAAVEQLSEYFAGRRRHFELSLNAAGTEFQQRCWRLLSRVPYGETRSYRWQAEQLGNPSLARAVGSANAANPLPIVIPCHRIINSSGGLGGYNLGLLNKGWLLAHEQRQ
ncbi:methylated-DNA--[protein]-cysteine S-methyltransferase [Gammaproteobacteria bacterium LSUCC0057]|uniref:Methylated-DNA--protein-cysteine methyltransferase n=1 Tax=Gammaproteobacteria bacterium LSUCC0057 TaxID=2559237 RepID=A0A4Y8UNF7_9GAMM|nr:methylated-DNA--[protein]-cysteine S-methyltransferase [Gammaproteobacteria bacterium LSUCC0057]